MKKSDKIFVAGHKGLVGSAILNLLKQQGYINIITKDRSELNLLNTSQVQNFFKSEKPDVVILAAAKVGGIHANNTFRADYIYENLQIQNNVIWAAHENDVHRLVFLGSSCIYPKDCPQPIKEEYLLTGELEHTNQPYAIAKIAGLELINSLRKQYHRDYFSVMPTNLFGPNDNFHPENSHVMAALIRKFFEAKEQNKKEVIVWGDGSPLREFMYSKDLSDAICFLLSTVTFETLANSRIGQMGYSHINIGSGCEISIKELAKKISELMSFEGKISFDRSMPNGTIRKVMNCSLLQSLGWDKIFKLENSLKEFIQYFKNVYFSKKEFEYKRDLIL